MRTALRAAIEQQAKSAEEITAKAETDNRPLTEEEQAKVKAAMDEMTKLKAAADAEEQFKAQRKAFNDAMGKPPADELTGDEDKQKAGDGGNDTGYTPRAYVKSRSIGEEFVNSAAYKALKAGMPEGGFSESMRVQSGAHQVKAPLLKQGGGGGSPLVTGTSDTSAGALVQNDYRGLLSPDYQRPMTIRQLVTSGTTTSDTIEYVRVTSVTNNAAAVPEATSVDPIGDGTGGTTTAELGGLKPMSQLALARDTAPVRTLAHWLPATKRALADAAQMRTLIDNFLRYGLEEVLEDQMLSGSGTGEDFTGLENVSGIQTETAGAGAVAQMQSLRIARRKVKIGGRANPTAYVINPQDWEVIEMDVDGNQNFRGNAPWSMLQPTLWGLPVVESEATPSGTAWCAAWNQAVLYDREQASIQVSDSHQDFFSRNLVAILCEMRAAFAVLRPAAFCKVTL